MPRTLNLLLALAVLAAACGGSDTPTDATATTTTAAPTTRSTTTVAPEATTTDTTAAPTTVSTTTIGTVDPVDDGNPTARILFSVSVQDFGHPDESARLLDRLIDLHEQTGVPVDVYLTDDMARILAADHPDLADRLANSPVVAISYHVRPPRPYGSANDWLGLGDMDATELRSTIFRYESHAVDPVTGETTADPGGYQFVTGLIGHPPLAAAAAPSDPAVATATRDVFAELGAVFTTTHGRSPHLGDTLDGLLIRPEQAEVRLWEHRGEDGGDVLDATATRTADQGGGETPFIGVKIHDNDFFATASSWVTVYVQDRRQPPWDPTLVAPLLTTGEMDAMWATYETTVHRVADRDDLEGLNLAALANGDG